MERVGFSSISNLNESGPFSLQHCKTWLQSQLEIENVASGFASKLRRPFSLRPTVEIVKFGFDSTLRVPDQFRMQIERACSDIS